MGYDQTTQIVKAPVSIYDIQRALGKSSPDLKTLAMSDTINKWAKFKPVKLMTTTPPYRPIVDTLSQLDMSNVDHSRWAWKNSSTWWRATNGMCGLVIHQYESLNDLLLDYFAPHDISYVKLWPWEYDTLDASNVARMTDFVGYRHNAIPPLHDFMSDKSTYFSQGSLVDTVVKIGSGFNVQDFSLGASLALADLGNGGYFSDYYFGVVVLYDDYNIVNNVVNYHGLITTSAKVGKSGFQPQVSIPIGTGGLPVGTKGYRAVGFLTSTIKSSYTLMPNVGAIGSVFSIGLLDTSFNIAGANEWIKMEFKQVDSYLNNPVTGTLRFYTYIVKGQGNYTKTSTGDTVRVYLTRLEGRFGSSDPGIDPPQIGEPVIYYPPGVGNVTYIDIPCRASGSYPASYYDLQFSLTNESGTGATVYPLRWVLAAAEVYHSGNPAAGSWNNTSGNKEVATANRQLRDTSSSQ